MPTPISVLPQKQLDNMAQALMDPDSTRHSSLPPLLPSMETFHISSKTSTGEEVDMGEGVDAEVVVTVTRFGGTNTLILPSGPCTMEEAASKTIKDLESSIRNLRATNRTSSGGNGRVLKEHITKTREAMLTTPFTGYRISGRKTKVIDWQGIRTSFTAVRSLEMEELEGAPALEAGGMAGRTRVIKTTSRNTIIWAPAPS